MNLTEDKDLKQGENLKKDDQPKEDKSTIEQQQTDPQLTELKGLVDPKEPLEVEGTDNPI